MRVIKRTPRFEEELARILDQVAQPDELKEAVEAVEWSIIRGPETGFALPDRDPNRFASMVSSRETFTIRILYKFDDDCVTYVAIRLLPPAEPDYFSP